ncbi:hypothetical protein PR048_031116 [Dryococelus australis]|uniref:Major facilitator superfamily (MFS) profile domain-containing protein n=1 Tax=Dryococelus australis TaxID=614101 RepID=A0ABQ9G4D5_9NEOP|nr:hypothetical protein PR048_031116 [Dryococelus australis]
MWLLIRQGYGSGEVLKMAEGSTSWRGQRGHCEDAHGLLDSDAASMISVPPSSCCSNLVLRSGFDWEETTPDLNVIPIYGEEISEVKSRGAIGTYCEIMICMGVELAFVAGGYMENLHFHIFCCIPPVLFLLTFVWMPESPMWLLMKGRDTEAEKSLRWLRGAPPGEDRGIIEELGNMRTFLKNDEQSSSESTENLVVTTTSSSSWLTPSVKVTFIVFWLMVFQQMSGNNALMFNTVNVYRDASVSLDSNAASMITGFLQAAAAVTSCFVVDLTGRRPLLIFSMAISTTFLALMGLYSQFKTQLQGMGWVPVVLINVFIYNMEVGFGPLPWLILAELAPAHAKKTIGAIGGATNWCLVFTVTKTYTNMINGIGLPMTYGVYSIFCFVAIFFVIFVVPETKHKTREQIQYELRFGRNSVMPVDKSNVLAYAVGNYVQYLYFNVFGCCVPVLFLLTFLWMPESPIWLLMKGKDSEAEKSLRWLRGAAPGGDKGIEEEMNEMRTFLKMEEELSSSSTEKLVDPTGRVRMWSTPSVKATFIVFWLMVFQQMNGNNSVLFNAVTVFQSASSSLDSRVASIITVVLQAIAAAVSSIIVDMTGRRPLMMLSMLACSFLLTIMALYFQFQGKLEGMGWVPVVVLTTFIATVELGFGPLPWLMMAELSPAHSKKIIGSIGSVANWFLVFVVTKSYSSMVNSLGMSWTYGVYTAFCLAGVVFVYFVVPETKTQTREQIQYELTYAYSVGNYVQYLCFNVFGCCVPVLFLLTFLWMPESSIGLLMKGKDSEAEKSLRWLRGAAPGEDEGIEEEMNEMRTFLKMEEELSSSSTEKLVDPTGRQMNGNNSVLFNAVTVFQRASSSLDSRVASIITVVLQAIAAAVSSIIVDMTGRRPLMMLSMLACSFLLTIMALYFQFQGKLEGMGWVPVVVLTTFIATVELGFGPLPWLMMAELSPAHSKKTIGAIVCGKLVPGALHQELLKHGKFAWGVDDVRCLQCSASPGLFVYLVMEVLYLARVISGLALGGATVVSPIYSVEIAEVKVRGELGTYCEVMLCLGILYAFCAGSYLPYLWFNIACAVVPVIFIAAFFWVPESPMYLVQKRRFEQAKETLQWFRGYSEGDRGIEEEIRAMDEFVRRAHVNQGEGSKDDSGGITSQAGLRACIIVYGLMALQQICGVCVFMYYAEKVFADAGSDLPAHVCSIIVASVQLVFGMVSSKVVDRLGRRPMLLSSAAILVVCLAAMSAYSAAKDLGKDVTSCAWLPLLTLNAFVVAFEFGVGPIPWLVMAEVSPDSSRAFITSSSVCFNWAVAFLVTKFFSDMTETIGLSLTYLTYGIFVSLGVVFVWFLVPETKGKSRNRTTIRGPLRLWYRAGGATVLSPVYNEEIAEVKIRGALGTYCEVMICVGIFYAFCVGSYLQYFWYQVACCTVPVLFFISYMWMPESPVYLAMKKRDDEAEKSLRWLRGAGSGEDPLIKEELDGMRRFVDQARTTKTAGTANSPVSDLCSCFSSFSTSSPTFKATYIVFGLMTLQQMCGTCAIMYYTVNVFRDAGSTLSPYICSIIVAFVQLVFGVVATRVVDHLGRRPMLMFSTLCLTVCLLVMAVYTQVKTSGVDVSAHSWIPCSHSTSSNSRGFISGSSVCYNWFLVFIVTKCFTNMIDAMGLAMTYGCYAIFMFVGFFFAWSCVPETNGKTREEIQMGESRSRQFKEAVELTCSEYRDMGMATSTSGGQSTCMLHASNMRNASHIKGESRSRQFKEAVELTCSEYSDMGMATSTSGGQSTCMLHASNMRNASHIKGESRSRQFKEAVELTCSEYRDMGMATSTSGGQSTCMLHASNMRNASHIKVLEVAAIDLEAGVQTTPKVVKGTGDDMLRDDSCDNVGLEFLECVRVVPVDLSL